MPTTLADLLEKYNGEDKCRAYLEELRWPNGPVCPKCESKKVMRVGGREGVLRCQDCNQQFTVTVGTIFHDSHLPLAKWFIAVCLICEAKKGMSALQLKRLLGTGYRTAWYLTHRIRQAMMTANGGEEKLSGIVEIDDTWIGGRNYGGVGSGRDNKSCVVGVTERNGKLRLMVVQDLTSNSIKKVVKKWVSKDLELIISDEFTSYVPAIGPTYRHKYQRIKHNRAFVEGEKHTNCIENRFSLLKRGIVGSWHKVSVKHLQRYLEEVSFRFSQRKNPALFSQTLLSLLKTDPLTFKQLTRKKAA
ncbi:MAG: IS1595 family transposase [Candidatus Acidiferrales bacterium]